jgi:hypothetical protein
MISNGMVDGFGGQLLCWGAHESQISSAPYFSIKINMGTVQQYGVCEGGVFSILDL